MDYNRNQRSSFRNQNQDWNDKSRNSRYEDDRYNSGSDYRQGNTGRDYDEADSGWQSRYEREDYNRGGYGSNRYGRQYDSDMNSGNYDRDSNYGSNIGASWGFGGMGSGKGYGNRNLYDRDYEGINRSSYSNSGTRLGAGNYGSYGDRGRGMYEDRSYGGYSGSNYGGNYYGGNEDRYRDRDRSRNDEDRSWWDRTTDEVSSWFGDEDAERRRDRDRQMSGMHRGKGPKNYNRSDERIKDDVNDRLSDDPFVDASEIDVTVTNGDVTLVGAVSERSMKRRAEDLADSVSGVKNVENRIRVGQSSYSRNPENSSGTTGSQSTSAVQGSERTRKKDYVTG